MRSSLAYLGLTLLFSSAVATAQTPGFQGAQPIPLGKTSETTSQLQIRFPQQMVKAEAFEVDCSPAIGGFESWADNNTLWTYNFKTLAQDSAPRLVGGAKCEVKQTADIRGIDGKTWKAGTLNYTVIVEGPSVSGVFTADGFRGELREEDPVVLITFDGPLDRAKFFAAGNGYLSYTSPNAPAEKMQLTQVPADQEKDIFTVFAKSNYLDVSFESKNWVLATVKQSLIPGAEMAVTVQNQVSAANPDVAADQKYTQKLTVRRDFQAEVRCDNPSTKGANCMPNSPVSVAFNGKVKWADVKDSYIEYIPFKSTDGKTVRSYPELAPEQETFSFNNIVNQVGQYIPYVAKFSDTRVDQITFNVNIEPQTQSKIVIPQDLKDVDGRALVNPVAAYFIRIGSMEEALRLPQRISFFEKNMPKVYLPLGVVNLNQTLSIRKTGTNANNWAPITDVASMIRIIRGYEARGDYRDTPQYTSPLDTLGVASNTTQLPLTGTKNRVNFLQFPFGASAANPASGFYAIEVSSPTYEAALSDPSDSRYYNPKYVLAQVTDLAVHLKKGTKQTVAWVTRLSDAQPVAGAAVQVYNCLGQTTQKLTTNAQGLVTFPNETGVTDCQVPQDTYSSYYAAGEFYVSAQAAGDIALTHTSWSSPAGYALSSPGVEYFYSDLQESEPNYHAIIGVNLVKPGQSVPIEIVAKVPGIRGFAEVPAKDLPKNARIVNSDDTDIYYDFPLTWTNGTAQLVWNVPGDASVKLGRYTISLLNGDQQGGYISGDIEVAEFKVPLMSGILSLPAQQMVKPDAIPVNAVIRYANGVGAKNLAADLSYYFEPTSFYREELADFTFGSGPVKLADQDPAGAGLLPSSSRPAVLQGLTTDDQGQINKDLGAEKILDGRSVGEVLKVLDRPQSLVVRVRYQDQMGEYQTLSIGKNIYNSDRYVGTSLVSGKRDEAKLRAAVVDVNGKLVTAMNDLELKVVRVESHIIGEELFGGLVKNTVERELKPVRWQGQCAQASQIVSCAVGALKAGTYAFQVTSKSSGQAANTMFKVDAEGRVYNENDYYYFGDEDGGKTLPLALNKKSYKDGEKAVVSFPAPFKTCPALVSIERSDVIDAWVSSTACEKGFVEVPVEADLAPNAFVSVYAVAGRAESSKQQQQQLGQKDMGRPTYRLGFANMKVDWNRFKQNVTVITEKAKYEPGETVNVRVNVTPEEGRAAGGTVTLVAIEEKILELKKNDTYNLLDALMQLRGHRVETISPLERVETVTAENQDLAGGQRKGGDEGGDGSEKSEFKRKLFNALVSFQPGVPVVNGVAQFSFKANDSLTRFKVIAIAMDSAQKFGTGDTVYLSEKETQAYSNIPSVAHTGDSYPVKVTVQNNSGKAQTYRTEVTVTVRDAQGNVIETKKLSKETSIGNASSTAVDVGTVAINDGAGSISYVVRVYDENGKLVDAMEPDAQTILPSVPLAIHDSFLVQVESAQLAQKLVKETGALAGKGEIRATLAKSLVTGATEQIQKRLDQDQFADFFIESRLYRALLKSTAQKPEPVKAVLDSLLGYVDSNGFVKYYPQAVRGSVFLTANILTALQDEPWALKLLPAALSQKLQGAVSQVLTKSVDPDYIGAGEMNWLRAQSAMGRAAYAFDDQGLREAALAVAEATEAALAQNPAHFGQPVQKWDNSDLLNVWLLQVVATPKSALTSTVYTQLTQPARLVYAGNAAALAGQPTYTYAYSDETLESARLLYGIARLKGSATVARALAAGIVNASQKAWYVSNTLVNVAQALKNFGRAYETDAVKGNAVVAVIEENTSTSVNWDSGTKSAELRSPWTGDKATVQVTQAGPGKPWLGVQALTAVPLKAARGQGIAIEKSVHNVTRSSGYQPGDILEVTLTLNVTASINHVALIDPIPAGSNILAEAYGDFSSGEKSYSGYKLYFETLPTGVSTVKYQYQLNNPGTFNLPPTRAEGLYLPSVFAETPNAAMTVQ